MKALRLCMALFFTGLLIGCSSSSGGGGSTTSSSSSGGTTSSSSSTGGPAAGTPFAGLPLDVDFILPRNEFFGGQSNQSGSVPYEVVGDFLAISDDATDPFYKVFSAGSRIRMANTTGIRFGNAYWGAGVLSTTSTTAGIAPEGDIDLSLPYTITIEIASLPDPAGQFQVDIDNSTSGAANSIHGSASQLVSITAPDLAVGTLEINVPGDVIMTPTGEAPAVLFAIADHVGTPNSFVKFRCPGNCGANNDHNIPDGFTDEDAPALPEALSIELSSIEVEYQDGGVLQPPLTPFVAPTLTADDEEIGVVANIMGNATGYDIGWSTTDDSTTIGANIIDGTVADVGDPPVSRVTGTITGLTNGTPYFVFVRASNAAGDSEWGPSETATPVGAPPAAPDAPTVAAGAELINVSWASVVGADAYDVGWSTTDDSGTIGANTIEDITGNGTTITGLTASTEYFVFLRAKNASGNSAYSSPGASATPTAPVAGSWTGAALDLFGDAGADLSGTVDVNQEAAVTITAAGGDLGSSHFRAFYASQSGISVPFTFTARLASITETDNGEFDSTGNSRRYGIYIMESIDPATDGYASLGRFAGLEVFPDSAVGDFVGSRSEKRDILFATTDPDPQSTEGTNRGRGATDISVGDWLRIQVSVDGDEYAIQRFVSTDGVNFTENTSNNEWINNNNHALPATVNVGFIAAPNADTVTIEFDNITIDTP